MEPYVARTKAELKNAINAKANQIIVKGEFAEKLNRALKIKKASKWGLGLIATSLAAVPATGGMSAFAAAPIAALTGIEIIAIIAVAAVGISLILLLLKEYGGDIIVRGKKGDADFEIELKRKVQAT